MIIAGRISVTDRQPAKQLKIFILWPFTKSWPSLALEGPVRLGDPVGAPGPVGAGHLLARQDAATYRSYLGPHDTLSWLVIVSGRS